MSSLQEKLVSNVQIDREAFEQNGTPYRMDTARLGEYVLQQVLKEQALDVFFLSRKEWYSFTDGLINDNEERKTDVSKFLHIHAQNLYDQEVRLKEIYQQVDELLND